jgi:hypothetical protein
VILDTWTSQLNGLIILFFKYINIVIRNLVRLDICFPKLKTEKG